MTIKIQILTNGRLVDQRTVRDVGSEYLAHQMGGDLLREWCKRNPARPGRYVLKFA